jgi:perosamine synthetase
MTTMSALAAAGGAPAVPRSSHRRWPEITAADRAAIERVLDRGELWGPNAPEVTALQDEWARYTGAERCLLVNSGTAALHCALAGAGVRPGDEVIVPAFSFVATPMAVMHRGATPVFCDIDPLIHTIDPARVESLVSSRTRAVMPVHVHGLPADMAELGAVARRHDLAVIEDAAQAHGATYRGKPVGTLGHGGAFSLNGSKNLSAGEGGLYVTGDEQAYTTARRLAIFGEDVPPMRSGFYRAYRSHSVGWNYRSHELTAALARSQLARLDGWNRTARRNARSLNEVLSRWPGLHAPHVPDDRSCVFYRYRIVLDREELGFDGDAVECRDRILHALQCEGVAASLWQLAPLPQQPVFRTRLHPSWRPDGYPVTSRLLESSIVIGTAAHPLCNQPAALMERYAAAFEKVMSDLPRVFSGDYRPVRTWPPVDRQRRTRRASRT